MSETIPLGFSLFGRFKVNNNIASNHFGTIFDFFLSGLWVFVTLLPTLMLANEDSDRPIGKQDYIGWALWATGMFFEVVADMQKTAFKNDPKNQVNH